MFIIVAALRGICCFCMNSKEVDVFDTKPTTGVGPSGLLCGPHLHVLVKTTGANQKPPQQPPPKPTLTPTIPQRIEVPKLDGSKEPTAKGA